MNAVIFDLDGTLVDSVAAICDVANVVLDELALPPLDVPEARQYIGNGAEVFMQRALAPRKAVDEADFQEHLQRFLAIYADAPGSANPPFPGTDEALRRLAEAGWALGLCTNKPLAPTLKVLDAHGWTDLFTAVTAGDSLQTRKPDPEPLIETARQLDRNSSLFVGDSEVDAETAKAAEMPFILFADGYRKSPVEALPHRCLFTDFSALPALLGEIVQEA